MIDYWLSSGTIKSRVFIPKYYDPKIAKTLDALEGEYELRTLGELQDAGYLSVATGDEIGKEAYGTGTIPFVRTSDISNWEIKTAPKQGVSDEIFEAYREKQDVQDGDVLLVRDGTYLIGTNCFVTSVDKDILYQSHILKFRINSKKEIPPETFFVALNSVIVQKQIRSFQFTADIIDTIGRRYREIVIPIIKDPEEKERIRREIRAALDVRVRGKALVKQAPLLLEGTFATGHTGNIDEFVNLEPEEIEKALVSDTVTLEFGGFEATFVRASSIQGRIYLPKYYDPEIEEELEQLKAHCDIVSIAELIEAGLLNIETGHEVGKLAYGTGTIPFLRTSDFANWEIKFDPKQCVSKETYEEYRTKQDLAAYDIFLVRDGTYLVGSSTIVQPGDERALFCGGLYRIRSRDYELLPPYLLLGILIAYVVKRQVRSKQFTRDVIDTLGKRLEEVRIPLPRDNALRQEIAEKIKRVVEARSAARNLIRDRSAAYAVVDGSAEFEE